MQEPPPYNVRKENVFTIRDWPEWPKEDQTWPVRFWILLCWQEHSSYRDRISNSLEVKKENIPTTPAPGKLKQKTCYEFQATWATVRPDLRKTKNKTQKDTEKESREGRERKEKKSNNN